MLAIKEETLGVWSPYLRMSLPHKTSKSHEKKLVQFAPVSLPFERRMQTFSILTWFFVFFVVTLSSWPITMYILFSYYPYSFILIPYLAWELFWDVDSCNRGGRSIDWVRNLNLWRYYRDYFPIKLIKTTELDPTKNYLIGCHPHGVLCSGVFSSFGTNSQDVDKVYPGIKFHPLTLEINFKFPFSRDLFLALGTCAATKKGMQYLLNHKEGGHAAVLIPGGATESLECHPGSYIMHLKKRKGFIKLVLQSGAHLVPCISFGETDIYDQAPNPHGSPLRKLQNKLQQLLMLAPVPFFGRGVFQYNFGPLPNRRPIHVVVGAPIQIQKVDNPSSDQICDLHQRYTDALVELFYNYREKYAADPNQTIIID